MVTTVRLNEERDNKLSKMSEILDKKKSDVLREALDHYAEYILDKKRVKFKNVIDKIKQADFKEYKDIERNNR
jgi:predicted DNA-binding protein